jgi:hypothetical protein
MVQRVWTLAFKLIRIIRFTSCAILQPLGRQDEQVLPVKEEAFWKFGAIVCEGCML